MVYCSLLMINMEYWTINTRDDKGNEGVGRV